MEQTKITTLVTPGVGEKVGARVGVIGAGVGAAGAVVGFTGAGVGAAGVGATGAGVVLLLDLPPFLIFDFLDLEDLPLRDFSFLLL